MKKSSKHLQKKLLTVVLTGIFIVTGAVSPAYAYTGEKSLTFTTSDLWVNTDPISAKEIAFDGSVNKSSSKSVWFISEYKNDTGWHYDTKILVDAGQNCPTKNSSIYTSKTSLRLQLNPYGTQTSGGSAHGTAWPVQ